MGVSGLQNDYGKIKVVFIMKINGSTFHGTNFIVAVILLCRFILLIKKIYMITLIICPTEILILRFIGIQQAITTAMHYVSRRHF